MLMQKNSWQIRTLTIIQIYKIKKLFDCNAFTYGAVIVEFIIRKTLGKLHLVSTQLTRTSKERENERDWVGGFVKAYLMSFDDRGEELYWRSHEGITWDIFTFHSIRIHLSNVFLCIRISKDKLVITFSLMVRQTKKLKP